MKYSKIIILFAFVVFVCSSCEDYLTKTIEFDDIGFEPQIVINSKVKDTLDYIDISISKNINYANNSSSEFQLLDDAEVKFFVDNDELAVEELTIDPYDNIAYNHRVNLPDGFEFTNKVFNIEVSHPDYPTAASQTSIAEFPLIEDIVFEEEARTGSDFGYPVIQDGTTFTIEDVDDAINYYKVRVIVQNPDFGNFGLFIESDDPLVLGIQDGSVIFSDEDFIDNKKEFVIYSQNEEWLEIENRTLEISNISESEFKFQESFTNYLQSSQFGFFSEPVTLFTNIENGLGIFSAEQAKRYPLE